MSSPSPCRTVLRQCADAGGVAAGVLTAVLILVAVAVAAFFIFGGKADVTVKAPKVVVSTSPAATPS